MGEILYLDASVTKRQSISTRTHIHTQYVKAFHRQRDRQSGDGAMRAARGFSDSMKRGL